MWSYYALISPSQTLSLFNILDHEVLNETWQWAAELLSGTVYYAVLQWRKVQGVTIQRKATEQFFPVVPFIMMLSVVLTELHPVISYWAVLSLVVHNYAVHGLSKFWVCEWNLQLKATEEFFTAVLFIMLYKEV